MPPASATSVLLPSVAVQPPGGAPTLERVSPDDPRRRIPRTDALLAHPEFAARLAHLGEGLVKRAIAGAQQEARAGRLAPEEVLTRALALTDAPAGRPCTLRPAINATGVIVHTNLGRAPLSGAAREALMAAAGYVDVEYAADTGSRARRGRGTLDALLQACPAAEDALVVNNGAAALSLVVTAFAQGRHVVISRGELVEIGDGFRIPELIASTGVVVAEVGTTNRTRLADYADAAARLGGAEGAGALLKIHPSNYRVEGFTAQASVPELASLARQLGVPLVVDIGSGLLAPDPALPGEPDASTALRDGADLVTCSGDKLLGGPQAGIVLGRAELVDAVRRHPLRRAFRADKLALAALEATLRGPAAPVTAYLHRSPDHLRALADRLADHLRPTLAHEAVRVVPAEGRVGGGGAPGVPLPGWAVALPAPFASELRRGDPLVVARLDGGACLLDPRCVDEDDLPVLSEAVRAAAYRLERAGGAHRADGAEDANNAEHTGGAGHAGGAEDAVGT